MLNVRTFTVYPVLPEKLEPLLTLSRNLWWTWNEEAVDLFRRIDPELWDGCGHQPRLLLKLASQARLDRLAGDADYLDRLERVQEKLTAYCRCRAWFQEGQGEAGPPLTAYFSAEFGLHESLPIYSGGLGVLAGDHLKAASDLGLPLVGVGLFYRYGYFHQHLDREGSQVENYRENRVDELPLEVVEAAPGQPLQVAVDFPGRTVLARVWRVQVGRIDLFLLDTNRDGNREEDRRITDNLYGGDEETRIQQEMILGIGGHRALAAMGIEPRCCHMNEGHSAFLGLERIRVLMEREGLSWQEARAALVPATVFTTHTPVPAGNDVFPPELLRPYFAAYLEGMGIGWEDFLRLGRTDPGDGSEHFCMTVLALRLARHRNGVSRLHGAVSRNMWKSLWPETPEMEIPIDSVTNGIHTPTWIGPELKELLARHLGPAWAEPPLAPELFRQVEAIPDEELWQVHRRAKTRLARHVRRCLETQHRRRGDCPEVAESAARAFDPEALTIGFARRFASYKRGSLIFRDLERITRILTRPGERVQLLFAGKAHPRNEEGKEFIRRIHRAAGDPGLRFAVIFLEDYDMDLARHLVQGVDLWLNNPRRPLEASGTSGMKVAANGGPNLSVLDGWWCEGYRPERGWAIGGGETWEDREEQDRADARAIYELLETEVVPQFYRRDGRGIPREWVARMKANLAGTLPEFDTGRMVKEYTEKYYLPAATLGRAMLADGCRRARAEAAWQERVLGAWQGVAIDRVESEPCTALTVGGRIQVKAALRLAGLDAGEVAVEIYHGPLTEEGRIDQAQVNPMRLTGSNGDGSFTFAGEIPCLDSGRRGYLLRVRPRDAVGRICTDPGLIKWG